MFFTPYYEQNRGNATTAKRIVKGLKDWGITVWVFAYEEQEWNEKWEDHFLRADLYHILHLKRFAEWFTHLPHLVINKPYILTSGGTDVNEDLKDPEAAKLMNAVADKSCGITVFSNDGKRKIIEANDKLQDRIFVIPQSVELPKSEVETDELDGFPTFLLPAGLRPVKDIFYLWDELQSLQNIWPDLAFYLVGPALDDSLYKDVLMKEKQHKWFHYLKEIPIEEMVGIYEKADYVLNTSISEGQSAAVLEAMSLGKMVFARNNAGNASVIEDFKTGVLFENPAEFTHKLVKIVKSIEKRNDICQHAARYVREHHSLEKEMEQYLEVYTHCLS